MENFNAQPILDVIHSEAKEVAEKLILEARDRAATISEHSAARIDALKEQTLQDAQREAALLDDRMRRLSELEDRKALVARKRALIDEVFTQALSRLSALPDEKVSELMLDLLARFATGTEGLAAGSVNAGFFSPAFLEAANARLAKDGKNASFHALPEKVDGVCGLVLKGANSEMHCTFSALLETQRESLEARVAAILFPGTGR